jgi:hypothetical protein
MCSASLIERKEYSQLLETTPFKTLRVSQSNKKNKDAREMLLRLCNPKPDLLDEVSRDLFRPDLSIQSRLASPEIGFRGLDELGLLVKLPEEEEAEIDWDDDVSTGKKELARGTRA